MNYPLRITVHLAMHIVCVIGDINLITCLVSTMNTPVVNK